MSRYITTPGGNKIPVGQYAAGWRKLKAADPDGEYAFWNWYPVTAREILSDMSAGLHDRINKHAPGFGVGRKWRSDWQREMLQASRQINNPRLIIHWLPKDLQGKFAHRLTEGAA